MHHNPDLPIRKPGSANPARRRTCRGNRPEDTCKCRHLPTMITSLADCRGAPVRGVPSGCAYAVHRIAVLQSKRRIPSAFAAFAALAAQSEQSRNLALPPAFPALHQECGRLTSTERVADSKPSFLLAIVDRDARHSVRAAFSNVLPRAPSLINSTIVQPSRRRLGFSFHHGLVDYLSDCGVPGAALRGSAGGMGDRPGQRNHVFMASSKRYAHWILGAVTALCRKTATDGDAAAVIRDTVYIDGGYLWWEPGMSDGTYGAPVNDGNTARALSK